MGDHPANMNTKPESAVNKKTETFDDPIEKLKGSDTILNLRMNFKEFS